MNAAIAPAANDGSATPLFALLSIDHFRTARQQLAAIHHEVAAKRERASDIRERAAAELELAELLDAQAEAGQAGIDLIEDLIARALGPSLAAADALLAGEAADA